MTKVYHIKQWHPLYERADTRKTDYMSWYCKQTKLVGLGIGFTLQQENNLELLGGWYLIEVLASQSTAESRGWLVRNGKPLTPAAMSSLIPTVKPEKFQALLDFFSRPEVDWLECLDWPRTPNVLGPSESTPGNNSQFSPRDTETTGRNSATDRQTDKIQTEREETSHPPASSSPPTLEDVKKVAVESSLSIPAAYAEHYWRKKNESRGSWLDVRKMLINWPQQLENWWREDRAHWEAKNGGATPEDLETRLARETDPVRRRQLKEQIENRI